MKTKHSISELASLIRRRVTRFWGQKYIITPRLLDWIEGDGRKLIYFTPLATRPQRYHVRIDSKTELDSDSFRDGPLEDIYTAVESEFGTHRDEYKHDNGRTYVKHHDWPALNDSCGCAWGELAILEKEDRRTEREIRAENTAALAALEKAGRGVEGGVRA